MGTRSTGFMRTLFLDLPRAGAARWQPIPATQPALPDPPASILVPGAAAQVHA